MPVLRRNLIRRRALGPGSISNGGRKWRVSGWVPANVFREEIEIDNQRKKERERE